MSLFLEFILKKVSSFENNDYLCNRLYYKSWN